MIQAPTAYIGFGSVIFMEQFSNKLTLTERIGACRRTLGNMFAAGELAGLPEDTQLQLRAIEFFLLGAADETKGDSIP
jgi:hypothetical protein